MKKSAKRAVGPEAAKVLRQKALWRVRNRALSILAQRHSEEFAQIKDELLIKSGLPPVQPEFSRTPTKVTMDAGLGDLP